MPAHLPFPVSDGSLSDEESESSRDMQLNLICCKNSARKENAPKEKERGRDTNYIYLSGNDFADTAQLLFVQRSLPRRAISERKWSGSRIFQKGKNAHGYRISRV